MKVKLPELDSEFSFKMSRSGGAGGQNVNKVSTKVELNFDVNASLILNDNQKERVFLKLAKKINKNSVLQLVSQEARTQLRNKEIVIKKFYELLRKCFVEPKKRKPTKPTKAAKEKRLETKKKTAEIKKLRKSL